MTTQQKFELKTSTKTKVIQVFTLRSKPYKIKLYIKIAEFFVNEALLPFCPTKTRWRRKLGKGLLAKCSVKQGQKSVLGSWLLRMTAKNNFADDSNQQKSLSSLMTDDFFYIG